MFNSFRDTARPKTALPPESETQSSELDATTLATAQHR